MTHTNMSQLRRISSLSGHRRSVIAAPCRCSMERMRFGFRHQHQALVDQMRGPLRHLRRQYQLGNAYMMEVVVWYLVSDSQMAFDEVALSYLRRSTRQPLFLYTFFWTVMLAATVAVAALSLEIGFSSGISPSMDFVQACSKTANKETLACSQCLRLPLDGPHHYLCVPAKLFHKSKLDLAVPPIFAGLVVGASALFVQGLGLWGY